MLMPRLPWFHFDRNGGKINGSKEKNPKSLKHPLRVKNSQKVDFPLDWGATKCIDLNSR